MSPGDVRILGRVILLLLLGGKQPLFGVERMLERSKDIREQLWRKTQGPICVSRTDLSGTPQSIMEQTICVAVHMVMNALQVLRSRKTRSRTLRANHAQGG